MRTASDVSVERSASGGTPAPAGRVGLAGAAWLAGPWPPALAATGWWLWAYLHTRPPSSALFSSHAGSAGNTYHSWSYAHLAYSDVLALWYTHHLFDHAAPYVHTVIEYPVLTGLFMWLAAWFPGIEGYFLASALALLACLIGSIWLLHRSSALKAWALACSPLLLVYTLLNWDLLGVVLMLAGYELYRSKRYAASGALFSLAVFAKFFPAVLFVYCLLALWRDRSLQGGAGAPRSMLVWAVGVGVVVNVPFAVANFGGWAHFFGFNATRGGGGGVLSALNIDNAWPVSAVDLLSAVLVLGVMALLAWRVLRGLGPEVAAGIAFGVFMLINKTYSPQYTLWVYVYAIVAEWPLWSLAGLALAGVADFANAMIVLNMIAAKDTGIGWYLAWLYPLNRALRLSAMGAGIAGSLWSVLARRDRGGGSGAPRVALE